MLQKDRWNNIVTSTEIIKRNYKNDCIYVKQNQIAKDKRWKEIAQFIIKKRTNVVLQRKMFYNTREKVRGRHQIYKITSIKTGKK